MLKEDNKLKCFLVLQSFCPLFLLIFIQHVGHFNLIFWFFSELFKGNLTVIAKAMKSSFLGDVVIMLLCIVWFLITVVVAKGFKNLQNGNYDHYGETIVIESEKKDSGVTFLVTFVLPLLVDDVSTFRRFVFFVVLLTMVIFLLMRSDLFYQNPVLVALNYKTFEFQFCNPYMDVKENKTYIGLTRGELQFEDVSIKRKYIADNVFMIYNDFVKNQD